MFSKRSHHAENYLDIAEEILLVIKKDGKVDMINRRGCEILGLPKEEIQGKDWFDNFLPERIKKEVQDVFKKIMQGERRQAEYHINPVVNTEGKERIISWHNTMLMDDNNRIFGTLSSGTDITELEELKKKVKQLEKKLK